MGSTSVLVSKPPSELTFAWGAWCLEGALQCPGSCLSIFRFSVALSQTCTLMFWPQLFYRDGPDVQARPDKVVIPDVDYGKLKTEIENQLRLVNLQVL